MAGLAGVWYWWKVEFNVARWTSMEMIRLDNWRMGCNSMCEERGNGANHLLSIRCILNSFALLVHNCHFVYLFCKYLNAFSCFTSITCFASINCVLQSVVCFDQNCWQCLVYSLSMGPLSSRIEPSGKLKGMAKYLYCSNNSVPCFGKE